jgi:hypothetical protein
MDNPTPTSTSNDTLSPPKPTVSRVQSFFELYANNVNFESSVWDLNVIFALLDQSPDTPPFKQLGSVHLPWMQAKIAAYFMCLNVAFHEISNGPITVPQSLTPPDIVNFIAEKFPDDPKAKAMGERINRIRAELGL